ncbi:unnamed protein product [Camellia sinensis]
MIYETPKPNTLYSKTKEKAMWRRLFTPLHRFAAAANISSTSRSPFQPSTISFSCSVTCNYGMKNVPLGARNILEDPELKNTIKAYSNWPTFPHIFIKGEFIRRSDIILNMHQTGRLKFRTNRGRIYQSTSHRNFRGTDMLNNDHMMIMFLAVTSMSTMAMVSFARTAITVTMMSPAMTMTSSTVTTIVATISVIIVTMLMNMMSPAMIVLLVNKMSPAVTVIASAVVSCTSVISTGVVVS